MARSKDERRRQRRDDIAGSAVDARGGRRGRSRPSAVGRPGGRGGSGPGRSGAAACRHRRAAAGATVVGGRLRRWAMPVARIKVPAGFNPRNPQQRRTLAAQLRSRTQDAQRAGPRLCRAHDGRRRRRYIGCAPPSARTRATGAPTARSTPGRPSVSSAPSGRPAIWRPGSRPGPTRWAAGSTSTSVMCSASWGTWTGNGSPRPVRRWPGCTTSWTGRRRCLRLCVGDRLGPAQLAACLSSLVYEARQTDAVAPHPPEDAAVRTALREMTRIGREAGRRRAPHRRTHPAASWTRASPAPRTPGLDGGDLASVLLDLDVTPGDFVRSTRQLIDLCDQVAEAAGTSPVREAARSALRSLRRGVVADPPPGLRRSEGCLRRSEGCLRRSEGC